MTTPLGCPSSDDLRTFFLGRRGSEAAAALEEHLSVCDSCARALEQIPARDALVDHLRAGAAARDPSDAQAAEELAARLAALLRSGSMPASGSPTHPWCEETDLLAFRACLDSPGEQDEIGRLAHYRVLRLLGKGGMGLVFLAEDVQLRRTVALKVMKAGAAANATARERFLREARAVAAVTSDHVVTIHQVGEACGVPYLAMQLLQGESLESFLERRPRPTIPLVLRLGREIAEALAAAHGCGLIHRDVKPANVWLEAAPEQGAAADDGEFARIKLLDFGLARSLGDVNLTESGLIAGTPTYMAPEQARGRSIDARTDLFGLGCVLYRLCTGEVPFAGADVMAVLSALACDTPRPVRKWNPDVPPALADLIDRLLTKDPAGRPPSARAVADELHALQRGETPRPRGTWRRRGLLAVCLLGLLVAGLTVAQWVRNDKGELVVEAPDAEASAAGEAGVAIRDRRTGRRLEAHLGKQILPSGEYEFVPEGAAGLEFEPASFTLRRGGSVAVVARLPRPKPPPPVSEPVDWDWVARVSRLPAEEQVRAVIDRLKELNPKFDGRLSYKIDRGVVREVKVVKKPLPNLAPLAVLREVRVLELIDVGASDIRALRDMRLQKLDLGYNPVTDLRPLVGRQLTWLSLFRTEVSDLTPLKGMPIQELHLAGTRVTDLSPLRNMPLVNLSLPATTEDLSPLEKLPLVNVIVPNPISEKHREGLKKVPTLRSINGKNLPAPVEWLDSESRGAEEEQARAVIVRLRECNPQFKGKVLRPTISEGQVRGLSLKGHAVTDLEPLADLKGLRSLDLSDTKVSDLTPLKGLPLERLDLGKSLVADLRPLAGMKLTFLSIHDAPVTDLTPLKGMPLTTLWMKYSRATDLEPLRGMKLTQLSLPATAKDLSPLQGMPLTAIFLFDEQIASNTELLRSLRSLQRINGKPAKDHLKDKKTP